MYKPNVLKQKTSKYSQRLTQFGYLLLGIGVLLVPFLMLNVIQGMSVGRMYSTAILDVQKFINEPSRKPEVDAYFSNKSYTHLRCSSQQELHIFGRKQFGLFESDSLFPPHIVGTILVFYDNDNVIVDYNTLDTSILGNYTSCEKLR